MSARDFLARMMSGGGGGAPVDAAAYQKLLEENMGRVGYDRDQAVRNTNIAGGYGNSTAQRFMHGGGGPVPGGGMPPDPMQTGAVPMPTPRPDVAPAPVAPVDPGIGSGIPMPEPGIGSGIPMPQLPREPNFDLPAQADSYRTSSAGGVIVGGGARPAGADRGGADTTAQPVCPAGSGPGADQRQSVPRGEDEA